MLVGPGDAEFPASPRAARDAVRERERDLDNLRIERERLIVDEPFTHLDERHAAQVWELLARVARRRQVVVTTQERGLLERLAVEPVIRLESDRVSNRETPDRPVGEEAGSAGAAR